MERTTLQLRAGNPLLLVLDGDIWGDGSKFGAEFVLAALAKPITL